MSRKATTKDKPDGRGGKRKGAGRKPLHGEAVVTSSISLPPKAWDSLDAQRRNLSRSEWVMSKILLGELAR